MRVLHVIDSLRLAGAETLVKDLALRASEQDLIAEVYVLCSFDTPLERALRDENVPIYSSHSRSVYSPVHVLSLASHLRSHQYDLVHVHLFPAQLWVALASRLVPKPLPTLVTTEHNTWNRRRRAFLRPLDRWMYAQYSFTACISEATRDNLVTWLPELRDRVPVLRNGVDVARFATASAIPRERLGLGRGAVVLCVGRFEPQKDQATLIRAIAQLGGVQLALVGNGFRRAELARLADELGISERVHFLGRRADVSQLLKASDIYVQPSRWEGFGIAALEAMASGLAVIGTDVPGLAGLVGGAGVVVPAGNPTALAVALGELLDDPRKRREVAARCADRARDFDISCTLRDYALLYHRAVDSGRADRSS